MVNICFNEDEKKEIFRQALKLIKTGLITGINFIKSDKPLPQTSVIVHYLHDSNRLLNLVRKEINKLGIKGDIILPRFTYYFMHPAYSEKPDFLEEYKNAKFLDENLNPKSIDEVVKNPANTIINSQELDLLIPIEKENVSDLVSKIQEADNTGSEKWIHPVIIVKGDVTFPVSKGFVKKDYASLSRQNAEFYSIVVDENKKIELEKELNKICDKIKLGANISLGKDSVIYFPSQINPEFEAYIGGEFKLVDNPSMDSI